MEAKEKILVAVLIGSGLLLFAFAIFPLDDISEASEESTNHLKTDESLSLSALQPSLVDSHADSDLQSHPFLADNIKNGYLVLYLIPANPCGSCMNEVAEYVELFDTITANGLDVKQVAWFHGTSKPYVEQFARIADFPIARAYSLKDDLAPDLLQFRDNSIDRQLILFDHEKQKVTFRVVLPTGQITPVHQKKSIISEAFPDADGFF